MRVVSMWAGACVSLLIFPALGFGLPVPRVYVDGGVYQAGPDTWAGVERGRVRVWSTPGMTREGIAGSADDVRLAVADAAPAAVPSALSDEVGWEKVPAVEFGFAGLPLEDLISGLPGAATAPKGRVNVYEVYVSGTTRLHLDLFDATASPNRTVMISGGEATTESSKPPVPEPGTVSLIGLGVMVLMAARLRRGRPRPGV